MKKIIFIIDSLNCGGAEKSLVSLLRLLDKTKYEIDLWIRTRGGIFEKAVPDHIRIIDTPKYSFPNYIASKIGKTIYSVVYRVNFILGIREHCAETLWKCCHWTFKVPLGKYDIAVAYQQGLPTYLVANKVNATKKITWINANIINAGYNLQFNSKYYDKVDVICTVSCELKTIMEEVYPKYSEKIHCIYDIVNPELVRFQAKAEINERDYNDKLCILTVGRLAPPKNYALAVKCAKILRDRGLDFCWYFIGEGEQRKTIEAMIAENCLGKYVKLLGLRTNPYPYMRLCDIYVQTSSFEGYGLTIAEAKILEKPIASTNFDVVKDQIHNGVNGLVSEMTPDALANAILRLAEDAELRAGLVNSLKQECNSTYLTEIKKIENIFDTSQ